MPTPNPPQPPLDEQPELTEAICCARRNAGDDDLCFVRELARAATALRATASGGGARTAALEAAPGAPSEPQLLQDSRYARNARLLADRTLGGDRVLGGKPVRPGDMLHCVAVGGDGRWGCTGTLIGPRLVLTAGHCAALATRVYFGHDVYSPAQGKVVGVARSERHPGYDGSSYDNDLMLLLLEEDMSDAGPARLAPPALVDAATEGRVVGFGHTNAGGSSGYGVKRYVDVPVASPSCAGTVGAKDDDVAYGCHADREIVAGRPLLEMDSCRGDSGGPFYLAGADGEWLLAAATSRSTRSATHACGDGGIYVRIDRYVEWICGAIPGAGLA